MVVVMDLSDQVLLAALIGAGAAILGGLLQSVASYLILLRTLSGQREQRLRDSHISVGAEFFEAAFHGLAAIRNPKAELDHREVVFLGERLKLVVDSNMANRVSRWTGEYAVTCMERSGPHIPSVNPLHDSLVELQADLRELITGKD